MRILPLIPILAFAACELQPLPDRTTGDYAVAGDTAAEAADTDVDTAIADSANELTFPVDAVEAETAADAIEAAEADAATPDAAVEATPDAAEAVEPAETTAEPVPDVAAAEEAIVELPVLTDATDPGAAEETSAAELPVTDLPGDEILATPDAAADSAEAG